MGFYLQSLGLLFVSYVLYRKIKNVLAWRALKAIGKKHGCGEPPVLPNKLPWGMERYKMLFTGIKGTDILEDIVRPRFKAGNTTRISGIRGTSIATIDPENIQAVLGTKFHDFHLGANRANNLGDLIGNGIFTADGEQWFHFRHQLRPQFTRDQVSDLKSTERHLEVLLKCLPEESEEGWVEGADLMPLFLRFTLDASTEFLFGTSVDSQSEALHAQDSGNSTEVNKEMNFAESMNYAQEIIMFRLRLGSLYWLISPKKFKVACQTVKDFTGKCVARVLHPEFKSAPVVEGEKKKYILLEALARETKDPIEIRDQSLHLLLAGRDTTAALMSWTIVLLSRHPDEFAHLRKSILQHFGTATSPTTPLTFHTLKSCKPLTYVLNETLRLYPIIPLNSRVAVRDTILPVGGGERGRLPIMVKKGEVVRYATYAMHRRHDIWGDDADSFRPGRWEGRKGGWEFIPFSGGPRVCIGQQYALTEASFVLVKLFQRYDKIEALNHDPIVKNLAMTMAPRNGAKVRMHRAAE